MDEYALKRIVGHSISDITERVYSKRGVEWLKRKIEKNKIECSLCDVGITMYE